MERSNTSFAQRSGARVHFSHEDMDFYLAWILGRQPFGGSDPEECLATTARIAESDPGSWQQAWLTLAESVETEGDAARGKGRDLEAGRKLLRACSYYRASMFIMEPGDYLFRPTAERMRRCFREANELLGLKLEKVEVEYQGEKLPGYFRRAASAGDPAPTLVVVGGIETFVEDCYFMMGPTPYEHGFNLLTVDLPGQGFTPYQDLHFGARMERPMAAVLEYATSRPEVDPQRLAIYGFSWGGHIVFKAARYDARVKAMIANPAMPNVFRAALAQQGGHDRSDPIAKVVFQQIAWRMGLRISFNPADIARRFGKAYDYLFRGKVDPADVEVPVLCLAGAAEPPITLKIAEECRQKLPHPKSKVRIFTDGDGSSAHCQVDNLEVPNGAIFQWLREVWR